MPYRERISKHLRDTVFRVKGRRCVRCRLKPATTCDHVKPVSHGGSTILSNLVPCCASCNTKRSNRAARTATNGYVK